MRGPGRSGWLAVAVAGLVAGSLVAPPLAAHVTGKVAHNWSHYLKLAKKTFYTEAESDARFVQPYPEDWCLDAGIWRRIDRPGPGELVITEVMANPSGDETSREWFEVSVHGDLDLNDLSFGREVGTLDVGLVELTVETGEACVEVASGLILLFARSANGAVNGGIAPDYTFGFALTPNTDPRLFVSSGGDVADSVDLSATTDGKAQQLDAALGAGSNFNGAGDNDDLTKWCDAVGTYDEVDTGSPGLANHVC